ncbi:MAG: hypothetical protein Q4C75_00270 [Bergeyella zoohelcum]|nr:hypothetical protein [Bergeyella zoohelcum]
MKKLIITAAVILVSQMGFSQVSFDGNKLQKDGQTFKPREYEQVFSNAEAKAYFKKARTNKTIGEIIAFTGGFGIGLGLGYVIFIPKSDTYRGAFGETITTKNNKGYYWTIVGIGAGITLVSIPFYIGFVKNSSKAIAIENST